MDESGKYMIVATYNHENYKVFRDAETSGDTRRSEARAVAERLFGRRKVDVDGNPIFVNGVIDTVDGLPLTNFFSFAGALPYLEIDNSAPDAEEKRANNLYGWVGIVPTDAQLTALTDTIGWPNSPFCKIFDIEIVAMQKVVGQSNLMSSLLGRDATAWKEKGFDIYEFQTPAMWRF